MTFKRQNSAKGFKDKEKDDLKKFAEFSRAKETEEGSGEGKGLRDLMDDLKQWKTKFSTTKAFLINNNGLKKTPDLSIRPKLHRDGTLLPNLEHSERTDDGRFIDEPGTARRGEGSFTNRLGRSPGRSEWSQPHITIENSNVFDPDVFEKKENKSPTIKEMKDTKFIKLRKIDSLEEKNKKKDRSPLDGNSLSDSPAQKPQVDIPETHQKKIDDTANSEEFDIMWNKLRYGHQAKTADDPGNNQTASSKVVEQIKRTDDHQTHKDNILKNHHVKPIEEKIDESVYDDLSVDNRSPVVEHETGGNQPRNELKDLNQFDFSKLVATKKTTYVKRDDLASVRVVIPKDYKR